MKAATVLGNLLRRYVAFLVDAAPAWLWRPGNLRFVGSHTVHFCWGHEGRRTIEIDSREIAVGNRVSQMASRHR
jgi:hypothetical protein